LAGARVEARGREQRSGAPRVHARRMRDLPRDSRHERARRCRAGPDARREPDNHRRADAAERPRRAARVDPELPALQARQRDAELPRPLELPARRADRLPGEPQVMAIATPPNAAAAERMERLEVMWQSRPGVLGWLLTTDHKRVGLL